MSVNEEKGVTLIELMVVIAILGVVAAVAVPRFIDWMPVMKLNSAAMDLLGDVREARQKSIGGGRATGDAGVSTHEWGVLYGNATSYQVIRSSGLTFQDNIAPVIEKTVTLPVGVTFTAVVVNNPIFTSGGTAKCLNPAGPLVSDYNDPDSDDPDDLVIAISGGRTRTIEIDMGGATRVRQ